MRSPPDAFVVDADDGKVFDCIICGQVGNLLCCDNCPRAYHPKCVGGRDGIDSENWSCWECLIEDAARDGVRVPRVSTPMGPVWVVGGYVFRPSPPPSSDKDGGGGWKSWEEAAREAKEAEAARAEKAAAEGEPRRNRKHRALFCRRGLAEDCGREVKGGGIYFAFSRGGKPVSCARRLWWEIVLFA